MTDTAPSPDRARSAAGRGHAASPGPAALQPVWEGEGTHRIPFLAYTSEELYRRELERFFYRGTIRAAIPACDGRSFVIKPLE